MWWYLVQKILETLKTIFLLLQLLQIDLTIHYQSFRSKKVPRLLHRCYIAVTDFGHFL
jgi:hypothetical protein